MTNFVYEYEYEYEGMYGLTEKEMAELGDKAQEVHLCDNCVNTRLDCNSASVEYGSNGLDIVACNQHKKACPCEYGLCGECPRNKRRGNRHV